MIRTEQPKKHFMLFLALAAKVTLTTIKESTNLNNVVIFALSSKKEEKQFREQRNAVYLSLGSWLLVSFPFSEYDVFQEKIALSPSVM